MHADNDSREPGRDDREPGLLPVRGGDPAARRAPLTMRHLHALGISLVGGGIPIALVVGGWAWLGLGLMVIVMLGMAAAHEGGWMRRRHRPVRSAPKRPRARRRSPRARTSPRHPRTRLRGGPVNRNSAERGGSRPLRLARGPLRTEPPLAGCERSEAGRADKSKADSPGGRP